MNVGHLIDGLVTLVQFMAPALGIAWADRRRAKKPSDARGDA